jgi:hypothetical protein
MLQTHPRLEQQSIRPTPIISTSRHRNYRDFFRSLADGLAASREYERQRMRGIPHNAALINVFGRHRPQ